MLLLSFITITLVTLLICGALYRYEFTGMKQDVRNEASYISMLLEDHAPEFIERLDRIYTRSRITVIASDGTVLYDNTTDPFQMENHLARYEVESAVKTGFGEAVRLSQTIGRQTYYYAMRLRDNTILRVAFTTDTVLSVFMRILPLVIVIFIIVFAIALTLAVRQSKQLVKPINGIDLDNPSTSQPYDELSPLLSRIRQLRLHIDQQVADARENQEKFSFITGNMAEGLIILNEKGIILSVNPSAVRLLGAQAGEPYRHILSLNRSIELQKIVQKVLAGQFVKENLPQEEKIIRVWASPVLKEGSIGGAILILLDATESQTLENFRREFSANVSHELKTPLTVISGFADLMRNQMVKPEDIPVFSEKIHSEAMRLIKLVEDILVISRLDENTSGIPFEQVDLLSAAEAAGHRLQAIARKKGVSLEVSGESVTIPAVPGLLDELIQNLCDNAIAYNKENGKVKVTVFKKDAYAVLKVTDTGIGIPPEHQRRVFERFYRADKSHSRQTGGTGLGLSIVKHVALYHRAQIKLESAVNKGTTITVMFPT
jgi:two-component system phosphate regulon sensor histidine kinase PhoR